MNLVIFGPPGAGKGTQSSFITKKYNLYQLSTGELLREEIRNKTELGKKISSIINSGDLVSDEIVSELIEKLDVPDNLLQLVANNQKAFLALKIVEIIGEDEPYQLDSETIFFVTNLLNKMDLVTIRNKVLNSALPLRT